MTQQELLEIVGVWRWPIMVIILVLVLALVFRKELGELIGKLKHFEFSSRKRRFKLVFADEVKNAKAQAKGIEREIAASRTLPVAERTADFAKHSARDIVLEAWGALKQIVYDACLAAGLELTPTTGISEAVHRLKEANALKPEIGDIINLLNPLGEQLAHDTQLMPTEDAARQYQEVAYDLMDWMMLNIVSRPVATTPKPEARPNRRPTVVSDFFPQPQPGRPAAMLDGIAGTVRAKQFPIEKEHFRIGRNVDNDLQISGDEFVSGHHASLRYQAGSLLLSDDGSRNGTFLNETKVKGTTVRRGDKVRIGNAVFQVSGASASQTENKEIEKNKSEFVG